MKIALVAICGLLTSLPASLLAQSVCLPSPRLLTTSPMGAQSGTQIEVIIGGENLDDASDLAFSDSRITAVRKLDAAGNPEPNKYVVTIAADCPAGIYESRVMTRLGMSSSRIFSVGTVPEVMQTPNTSLAAAMNLALNTVCNGVMTHRGVDHYAFDAHKGERVVVDCASRGIDSKLDSVLILADAAGRDLKVVRSGGVLEFTPPEDGRYIIKVHDITFKGGADYYYRLALSALPEGTPIPKSPATKPVNSFSWPPTGLPEQAAQNEIEPNQEQNAGQQITLPCDISGAFFPAADVDVYEFDAKKGEEWWIEVGSERFGLPTDPSLLVQRVVREGDAEKLVDVLELNDIPSPVKVSSNGYAYDGPPYNAGTSDPLGKLVIPEDGHYRLQLRDLFGGTRKDPRNIYRLVIRRASPDFALVSWAMHMELRNGDRNALSKPISLRGGGTMALEVVAIRRDGFEGEIDLVMENLPEGVTARGLKIPAGQSRGMMLVTAAQNAPRALTSARFYGRSKIGEGTVIRDCRYATIAWPIRDSWGEIPYTRLLADVPVSVSGLEQTPLTIAPAKNEVWEVSANEKLTIPLVNTRRSEFSGAAMQLKTMGAGFEQTPQFELSLTADNSQAVLDLATLKTPPGDYLIAFYGGAVAKYRHHPEQVPLAEEAQRKAEQEVKSLEAEVTRLTEEAKALPVEKKASADKGVEEATARLKSAAGRLAAAAERLKSATAIAQPQDIVDIVVSEPISLRVKPVESK